MAARHKSTATDKIETPTLPTVGLSRWANLSPFVAVSRETWRKLVMAGKAPQPKRLGERCTVWDNSEVHEWLRDPAAWVSEPAAPQQPEQKADERNRHRAAPRQQGALQSVK